MADDTQADDDMNAIIAHGGFGALTTVQPAGNLPTSELAPYLVPQRIGDPLGLGIDPATRPPAPADPDVYDRDVENKEYARSMLETKEREELDAHIEKEGYMTIDEVRKLVLENTSKGSVEAGGIDPEIMALIDARINYKLFVAEDNIYLREELYENFPFHELNAQPEVVFAQQEIGIFPARKYALATDLDYVARDVGDETIDFMMIEDLVGQATKKGYTNKRAPLRVVKTKIYIGKDRWDDFVLLQKFFRAATRIASAQIAYNGGNAPNGASGIFSMFGGGNPNTPMITDLETVEAEKLAREEEMRKREEELRRREEEQRRAAAETQAKLDADLKRIEEMLATVSAAMPKQATTASSVPPTTASSPADEDDDSVPL